MAKPHPKPGTSLPQAYSPPIVTVTYLYDGVCTRWFCSFSRFVPMNVLVNVIIRIFIRLQARSRLRYAKHFADIQYRSTSSC